MGAVEGFGSVAAVVGGLILDKTAVLSAATITVAALGLFGCGHDETTSAPPASPPPATTAAPSQPAQLPDPAALTDVLAKLSDPAVPGAEKVALIEGATQAEIPALDSFGKALQDNHMLPLTFIAADLAWSEQNRGTVRASVTVTSPKPDTGPFTFPMEFAPTQVGWQLSRETADLLLAFGDDRDPEPAPATPTG